VHPFLVNPPDPGLVDHGIVFLAPIERFPPFDAVLGAVLA
jgi:hypothetical protein